mmetsp:Transcript_13658/g.20326  ORF Transcript_13658/g.20326 Transcript_13658/m.20326 type:complete len:272 (-) Transcript_13658:675-1490(-)
MNYSTYLWRIFESPYFDPLSATFGFIVPIFIYTFHEMKSGNSAYKSWGDFLFREGERNSKSFSLLAYWAGIMVWGRFIPRVTGQPSGIPTSVGSLLYLLLEIASGIILYDAFFFVVHWAMHEVTPLRFIHREHHKPSRTIEAQDVLRHSMIDGSLQVLVNILVQRNTPWGTHKSILARMFHNVIVTWMLTESHSSSPKPDVFRRWCVGCREHRQHHLADGDGHGSKTLGRNHRYQQFFGYLDIYRNMYALSDRKSINVPVSLPDVINPIAG